MGDIILASDLRVGDVYRSIGLAGNRGVPRRVTHVRQLCTVARYTIVSSVNAESRVGEFSFLEDVTVERMARIDAGEAMGVLDLMSDGETVSFTRFNGGMFV